MSSGPDRDHRRSIRLRGYDCSQVGAYFVTICTQGRDCRLGELVGGQMCLNDAGRIAAGEWLRTAAIRPRVELDALVIMPNWAEDDENPGRGMLQRAPTAERALTGDAPTEHPETA